MGEKVAFHHNYIQSRHGTIIILFNVPGCIRQIQYCVTKVIFANYSLSEHAIYSLSDPHAHNMMGLLKAENNLNK